MFHFIKRLEKEGFIAAALLIAIVALTTKGFGGDGRDAMTAMAETPAVSQEPGVEYGQQIVGYLLTRDMKRQKEVRSGEGVQNVGDGIEESGTDGLIEDGGGQMGDGLGQAESSDRNGSETTGDQRRAEGQPASGDARSDGREGRTDGSSARAAGKEDRSEGSDAGAVGKEGKSGGSNVRSGSKESSSGGSDVQPGSGEDQSGDSRSREAASGHGAVSLTEEDYQVLLKIVEAEAGVCDKKGKILVANVILNRMKSDQFPDTVTGVVYQPSQFSPVSNGSINTCKVSSDTKESVDRALKGEDYSQGALFFMNRSASRSGAVSWFDGKLTYLFRYQGHEFFK